MYGERTLEIGLIYNISNINIHTPIRGGGRCDVYVVSKPVVRPGTGTTSIENKPIRKILFGCN